MKNIMALVAAAVILGFAPASLAHECQDETSKTLMYAWLGAVMKYPTKPVSEEAIGIYKYVATEATRPQDEPLRELSCRHIIEILYDNGVIDGRESDYEMCPEGLLDKILDERRGDPDAEFNVNRYLPIVRVGPIYPKEALEQGLSGSVILEFTVTKKGTVKSPKVVSSTNEIFEHSATRSVLKFKYRPHKVDGKPVKVRNVKTLVSFDYEDETHPDHCDG